MRRVRLSLALAGLCVAAPASAAPAPRAVASKSRTTLDRVIAVVNDDIVLESELDKALEVDPMIAAELEALGPTATPEQRANKMRELRVRILDALIEHRLILAEAPRFQITATDADLTSYLQNLADRNGMASIDELRRAVVDSGQFGSWGEYRRKLREDIIVYKVQNVLAAPVVTEAQVRERYRKMSKGEEAKVEVVRFVFRPADPSSAARDVASSQAKQIARRIGAGEELDALADELGQSSESRLITRREIAPDLADALFVAKPGEVVGPLRSGQGFVVYKIVAIRASDLVGYEQAKDRLRLMLEEEAMAKASEELREQLRARAHIDVRL